MNLYELIWLLPTELVEKIRKLTYKPQSNILLNDIASFHKTKNIAIKLYYKKYKHDIENGNKISHIQWFINDIELYCNNNEASMNGYTDKMYNILSRTIIFKNKEQMSTFLFKIFFNRIQINTEINILWGLLLPKERTEMLALEFMPELLK